MWKYISIIKIILYHNFSYWDAGFQATGIHPFNRDIFSDADYAPSAPTDQEIDVNNDDPEVLVATEESMPNIAPTPETPNHEPSQPPESAKSYVSPSDIHPLLKAPRRAKSTRGRKKATTRILTNTPVRDEIASKYLKPVSNQSNKNNSQDVIATRSLFQSKKLQQKDTKQSRVEESSSDDSESDMEIEYESEDTEPEDLGFIEGDFVIVRVEGKKVLFIM